MTHHPAAAAAAQEKTQFGFWVYLMTDCILFASLFATFVILRGNINGGPGGHDIFDLPFVLVETLLLLASSFTCGVAVLAAKAHKKSLALTMLAATFILGLSFLVMELTEFAHLAGEGYDWRASAFLSSFFTLVGTHGAHIAVGLLWLTVMAVQVARKGFTDGSVRRLTLFGMFWHFLDIIWIFIFTIVYLVGVI